ncbi:protein lin-52 homolog isoform X2 [Cylas formicarius]|uniref:protein lin-52 homolog isoform X2 n=1 Tax=Cylas formicarius TaxID=197179 RepID=UPI002958C3A5|nr:protein lin-52 homolog isoform X2 [Cylas formicarius]
MADEKPGSVEQEGEHSENLVEFGRSLLAMENLDRASPEMWPEKIPGMTKFMNSHNSYTSHKMPYSRELNEEDQNYLHQLASLSTSGLIAKVKELHDIAYQLGVEESKEITKGKYLNLFNTSKVDE